MYLLSIKVLVLNPKCLSFILITVFLMSWSWLVWASYKDRFWASNPTPNFTLYPSDDFKLLLEHYLVWFLTKEKWKNLDKNRGSTDTHRTCTVHNIDSLKYCHLGYDINKLADSKPRLYCNTVSCFHCLTTGALVEHVISKHAFQAEVCQCVGSLFNLPWIKSMFGLYLTSFPECLRLPFSPLPTLKTMTGL